MQVASSRSGGVANEILLIRVGDTIRALSHNATGGTMVELSGPAAAYIVAQA